MAVDEEAPEGGAEKDKDKGAGGGTSILVKILIIAAVAAALVTVTVFVSWKVSSTTRNPVGETGSEPAIQEAARPVPRQVVVVGEIKTVVRGKALKMSIELAFDGHAEQNKGLDLELTERLSQLRDRYLTVLFNMSDAQLAQQNIGSLKDNLREETNKLLRNGQVAEVYITDYVYMGQ